MPIAGTVPVAGAPPWPAPRRPTERRTGRARTVQTAVPAAPSNEGGNGREVTNHGEQKAETAEGQNAGAARTTM